jgi:hypothetical protein
LSTDAGIQIAQGNDGTITVTQGGLTFTLSLTSPSLEPADYKPLVIKDAQLGSGQSSGSSTKQDTITAVISDLSSKFTKGGTNQFSFTGQVHREADFNDIVSFFAVDSQGNVLKADGTTAASLNGDSQAYKDAITGNLLTSAIQVSNHQTVDLNFTVSVSNYQGNGFIILPILGVKVGSSFTAGVNTSDPNSAIYYPILGINSDKFDRMAFQGFAQDGSRYYGFEDLAKGGDKDFNDFIVKINPTA